MPFCRKYLQTKTLRKSLFNHLPRQEYEKNFEFFLETTISRFNRQSLRHSKSFKIKENPTLYER